MLYKGITRKLLTLKHDEEKEANGMSDGMVG
jgi:hypothetical protein